MMDSRFKRLTAAIAFFLAFALSQAYLPVSLAESAGNVSAPPQQAGAILTTGNNQPITVNGANAVSGATIMTGAAIETPDQIGASLTIPGHFTLDIAAKASVTLEFDRNSIKVNLIKGCVVLHTKQGTTGEISTSRGVVAKSDGSKDARLDVCDPSIATAPAAAAGGLGAGGKIAIAAAVIGAIALIPILTGGGGGGTNPSPSAP